MSFAVASFWRLRSRSFRCVVAAALCLAGAISLLSSQYQPGVTAPALARAPEFFALTDPDQPPAGQPQLAAAGGSRLLRKYDTFAHWALDLESEAVAVSPAKYALLDDLIDDVKGRIQYDSTIQNRRRERRQAIRILRAIDAVLTDHNVLYPPGEYDTTSLRLGLSPQKLDQPTLRSALRVQLNARRFDHALASADGSFYFLDCDTASLVYLGIADGCGFGDRLHLVDLPDHMFVRWVFSDGSHLNWDTNDASIVDDADYADDYHLTPSLRRRRIYLASMTREQARAHVYFLRAANHENAGRLPQAIADMETVRRLNPRSTQAASDLAWLYATTRQLPLDKRRKALELAAAATAIEPRCGDFWDTLAAAQAVNGDFDAAVISAGKAIEFALSRQERADYRARQKSFQNRRLPAFE